MSSREEGLRSRTIWPHAARFELEDTSRSPRASKAKWRRQRPVTRAAGIYPSPVRSKRVNVFSIMVSCARPRKSIFAARHRLHVSMEVLGEYLGRRLLRCSGTSSSTFRGNHHPAGIEHQKVYVGCPRIRRAILPPARTTDHSHTFPDSGAGESADHLGELWRACRAPQESKSTWRRPVGIAIGMSSTRATS